ncbi:hypothetical protein MFIFM68171_05592 [Madurella fahalii]|uniref:Uncharacterized protein n=1 Tax=Madurella fahalii TaxID=1157608 RepID=A0ABQ0GC85_9PEZI
MATPMPEWQPKYSYSPLSEPAVAFASHQSVPELVNEDNTTKEIRSVLLTPDGKRPVPLAASASRDEPNPRKTAVRILSILVGVLTVAVVGLAVATGVIAKRAGDAESLNVQLGLAETCPLPTTTTTIATATVTAMVFPPTGQNSPITVPVDPITTGCAAKDEKISGTTYTTELYGKITFARYCNLETRYFPFYALAAASFEACLDACAAYLYCCGLHAAGRRRA